MQKYIMQMYNINGEKMDIEEYRNRIDLLDEQITKLITERFETACEIGLYKKENGIGITDSGREEDVIKKVRSLSDKYSDECEAVYREIISQSKKIQSEK